MRKQGKGQAVLVVMLIAFALRVYALDTRSIWYDEAFSIFLAEKSPLTIAQGTAADIQPPLYYWLLHLWQSVGEPVFVMRFLSVCFSMLSVAIVFPLTRRLLNDRAAAIAALLVAVAPFQIAYAQELRMYSLLECALLMYLYVFVKIWRGQTGARWIAVLALAGAAGLYAQSVALLTWVVPDVYAIVRRNRRVLKPLLAAQGITLVLFLPWILVMGMQLAVLQQSYWTARPGLAEVLQFLLAMTTFQPLPAWFLPVALFVTLGLLAWMAMELVRSRKTLGESGLGVVVAAALVPPLLMIGVSYAGRSIFIVRGLIVSTVAFAILVAWLLARIPKRVAQYALTGFAALFVIIPLAYQYGYSEFPRSPFSEADAFLRAHVAPGDMIIHDNKLSYFPMHYYDRSLAQSWLADPPNAGSNTLSPQTIAILGVPPISVKAANGRGRVWFVIFQRAINEAGGEAQHGNLAWIDGNMKRLDQMRFNDLDIYLYERPAQSARD